MSNTRDIWQLMEELVNEKLTELVDQRINELVERKFTALTKNSVNSIYPEVMNINHVSSLTGYSTRTIYQLKSKGEIPSYSPLGKGGKLYFKRDEIYNWMTSRKNISVETLIANILNE